MDRAGLSATSWHGHTVSLRHRRVLRHRREARRAMAFTEGFISELVGRQATINDLPIGKVSDFLVSKPDDTFPQIDGLVIKTSQGPRFAAIDTVADVDRNGTVALTMAPKDPAPPDEEELYLVKDLLDKQIVDVDGRKVVRINDIELANTGGRLRIVAADVGVAGLLRRLGLKSFGRRFTPTIYRAVPRSMIAWDSVAPIHDANPSQVRLSVKESKLARLHPSELAEIISDLSSREALAVVRQLDDETAADAFEHLDAQKQKTLIEDIGTERAADIIEEMDADDAADLLAELPQEQRSELLAEMNTYTADELRELVKYPEDTAGGLMTTDYVWIYPHRTTEATIRENSRDRSRLGIHLLPLRGRQGRSLARDALAADPFAGAAHCIYQSHHGDRYGHRASRYARRRRGRNDREVRSARRPGR